MITYFEYSFDEIKELHKELLENKRIEIDNNTVTIHNNDDGTVDGTIKYMDGDGNLCLELNLFLIDSEQLLLMFLSSVIGGSKRKVYCTCYNSISEAEENLKED